eukprot:3393702-Prorocentrum_lima.AAC.1
MDDVEDMEDVEAFTGSATLRISESTGAACWTEGSYMASSNEAAKSMVFGLRKPTLKVKAVVLLTVMP